jgi:hypothetical protein
VSLLLQATGSAFILAAFAANQIGMTSRSSRPYLAANTIGSFGLAASALLGSQWGFLALEGAWFVVSALSLRKTFAPPPPERDGSSNSSALSTRTRPNPNGSEE